MVRVVGWQFTLNGLCCAQFAFVHEAYDVVYSTPDIVFGQQRAIGPRCLNELSEFFHYDLGYVRSVREKIMLFRDRISVLLSDCCTMCLL